MIQINRAASRYSAKNDWLESNFSFSFGEYYDESNIRFGALRVLNDDTIQPGKGFGLHPHREMEIVSIVLKGTLKHEDSLKNSGNLQYGSIQRMSAGTGILHSEFNPSDNEEASILQLWFFPDESKLTPSYEDVTFDLDKLKNNLLPVVSPSPSEQVAKIHTDLTIYLSKLDKGKELVFRQEKGRKIYVFTIEGELGLNQESTLGRRDDARITDTEELTITSNQDSFFMLIDLPGGE
ncbi:pirin family protein [Metabacillus rhizolycopersici]|uniref:Pirin family protein n=1 Tax=Metabacillus rhizolycopersici TaxID=2875709 RepID=A0ABS7UZA0_9BACI|nr:pirin family protein [Metabacillus rhizolycopersici]MBZ5753643.1 pirin family protein [Metabacillus rhizolycopersici]